MTRQDRPVSPTKLGYRWPAEWEPHAATWMAWPRNPETWPGIFDRIPGRFAALVEAIGRFEPVHILAGGEAVRADAESHVGHLTNVTLHDIPTDDLWIRDYGPTFLVGGPPDQRQALIAWQYNAWGGKYPPWDNDNGAAEEIARQLGRRCFSPSLVLEGGAVEHNGRGTFFASTRSLVCPNRNGQLTRDDIERWMGDYLGAEKVIWLDAQVAGDDTDGHVDQTTRFVSETCVVVSSERSESDENYRSLRNNFQRLRCETDADGRPLDVVELGMPQPIYFDGRRVPASYSNYCLVNGGVIMAEFDDPADEPAKRVLASLFPDREVVAVPGRDLVWGLGGFHCMTQQEARHTADPPAQL